MSAFAVYCALALRGGTTGPKFTVSYTSNSRVGLKLNVTYVIDIVDGRYEELPIWDPLPAVQVPATDYDDHWEQHTPLCIDNGSTHLRFGFCTSDTPRTGINMVAKYKERRTNKPLLLFGEGIDVEGGARSQAKTPWEGDVLLNFDALKNALDYAFIHLGIDVSTVDHLILMTERLASPLHSRACHAQKNQANDARSNLRNHGQYSVPSLTFCVDSVMSFYHSNLPSPPVPFHGDGLVVSFNTASTSQY
ncbi:hypothetical protein C8Q74DRAFT_1440453 [Fomes fomentarius]|nr:hypothetical protein C8Q74DRAFT_1440453 [Fomes fomentarius]